MPRISPRLARRAVCAAVAVPALLVAGCSSDSGGPEPDAPASSTSPSASPSEDGKSTAYAQLPDPCKTVPEKTVEDVVPGTEDKTGKNLPSNDTDSYGACLWSGGSGDIEAEYRALTVSLKRYESDASLGSGDEQAERYLEQEAQSVKDDEGHQKPEQNELSGIGEQAVSVTYETEKKENTYRATRIVVRDHNVVVTVDYEGTGFEDADPPSRDEVRKKAEKVAKEAATAIE